MSTLTTTMTPALRHDIPEEGPNTNSFPADELPSYEDATLNDDDVLEINVSTHINGDHNTIFLPTQQDPRHIADMVRSLLRQTDGLPARTVLDMSVRISGANNTIHVSAARATGLPDPARLGQPLPPMQSNPLSLVNRERRVVFGASTPPWHQWVWYAMVYLARATASNMNSQQLKQLLGQPYKKLIKEVGVDLVLPTHYQMVERALMKLTYETAPSLSWSARHGSVAQALLMILRETMKDLSMLERHQMVEVLMKASRPAEGGSAEGESASPARRPGRPKRSRDEAGDAEAGAETKVETAAAKRPRWG